MQLVITEKPAVAISFARILGATKRCDGYLEGNGYLISWCVGHLVELAGPAGYVGGKINLPPLGKEFFHAAVSSFLHPSVRTFLHDTVTTFLHRPVSTFFFGQ